MTGIVTLLQGHTLPEPHGAHPSAQPLTDAAARPGAERDEGVVVPLCAEIRQEVVRVEDARVRVVIGVPVQHEGREDNRGALRNHVAGSCKTKG